MVRWNVLDCIVKVSRIADSGQGNWIAKTPIPNQTLKSREARLKGQDKQLLLALVHKILRWLPEDRPTAQDLFDDGFITQWVPTETQSEP